MFHVEHKNLLFLIFHICYKTILWKIVLSFQFIAQTKPDQCDVVFSGNKEGFMSKKNIERIKKNSFYNKYIESEILRSTIYNTIWGRIEVC
jgi:hypothetical protein